MVNVIGSLPVEREIYWIVKKKQAEISGMKKRIVTLTEISSNLVLLGLTHNDELIKEIEEEKNG